MFLFLRKFYIAQHFAQLRLGTKQRTQFFRENKYLKKQEEQHVPISTFKNSTVQEISRENETAEKY